MKRILSDEEIEKTYEKTALNYIPHSKDMADELKRRKTVGHRAIAEASQQATLRAVESSVKFAENVARCMDELRSSHVFFILQQAYKNDTEDLEWEMAQSILDKVISECVALKRGEMPGETK